MVKQIGCARALHQKIYAKYRNITPLSYISITNQNGSLRLDVKLVEGKLQSYYDQSFNRQCLRVIYHSMQSELGWTEDYLSFVLIDFVRGNWIFYDRVLWSSSVDDRHPIRQLINTSGLDTSGTKKAFLSAKPDMGDKCLKESLILPEASRYRFIDCLLKKGFSGKVYTENEALELAWQHARQLT